MKAIGEHEESIGKLNAHCDDLEAEISEKAVKILEIEAALSES